MFAKSFELRWRSSGWLVVLGLWLSGTAAVAQTSEAVLANYRQALAALEVKFDHARGEGLFSSFKKSKDQGFVVTRAWMDFELSGGRGRLVTTGIAQENQQPVSTAEAVDQTFASLDLSSVRAKLTSGSQGVYVYNGKYSFNLTKGSAGFVVRSLETGDKLGRRPIDNRYGRFTHAATDSDNLPVTVRLDSKKFHLERISPLGPGDNAPLRLDYTQALNTQAAPATIQNTSGWLVVLPAAGWLISEFGIVQTPTSRRYRTTSVGQVSYEPGPDGQPQPIRTRFRVYDGEHETDPGQGSSRLEPIYGEDFRFASFQFGDSPESDFTLTAFGLPEFGQTVAQETAARAFPWWLVGSAVGFGGLALLLRRLARRGAATSGAADE